MELKPRDTQTQVKHKILEKYLGAWGGIILNGLKGMAFQAQKQGKPFKVHFVYVDCFSYVGRYSGNTEDIFLERTTGTVPGSPIIGIRVLDELTTMASKHNINLTVNAILIEEKQEIFKGLLDILSAEGLGQRVRETVDFLRLKPSEIAVVNGDSTNMADKLLEYTRQKYTWAFYLIDPYGPLGIPYNFVQSIVKNEKHDVMINSIYYDLAKKTGAIEKPGDKSVENWTKVFGDARWKQIIREIDKQLIGKQRTEQLERKLVDLYKTVLLEMDFTLAVKTIRLLFPDKERPMFHLFLTTHDPNGAITLNKILFEAILRENQLRYIRAFAEKQRPPEGQLSLFKPVQPEVPQPEASDRPTVEECADYIARIFAGKTVKRREVYRVLADEIYFDTEINGAISFLKRNKRINYEGKLSHDTSISFTN